MVRAAQDAHEAGRLLKQVLQTVGLVLTMPHFRGKALIGVFQLIPGQMFPGNIVTYDQHATHAGGIPDGAVAIGPPDVLAPAVTRDGDKLILVPRRRTTGHDGVDLRADDRPYFLPALAPRLAQRTGVPLRPHGLPVRVVIKLD